MRCVWGAWLVLAAAAWCGLAGPGPPPAAFRWPHPLYNLTLPENSPPRTAARSLPATPLPGVPLPEYGAKVRFRIRHGDKEKFFKAEERTVGDFCFLTIRTRAGNADVLNRERRDHYHLDVRATATLTTGERLESDTAIDLVVTDVNDLSPLFYPTEYDVLVSEDLPPHASVAQVAADDADLGLNGEIYYSFLERTDQFAVHPTSGVVSLTRPLDFSEKSKHQLTVLAHDRASLLTRGTDAPAARAALTVRVSRANLHAPELRARRLPELMENSTAEVYAIIEVTDQDGGAHGRIASVDIVDGDPDGHFRVRPSATPNEWDVLAHALLDRERAPRGYNLTLRAVDAGRPPRAAYLALPVRLADANDHAPVFSRELYEASVPETAPPRTPLVRLKVSDRDAGANARVYIEIVGGNEGGEFRVNPDTGVLYTAVPLDAETKSLYTLTVSAVDQGNTGTRKQSSAKVKITVIDANDNDPVFEQDTMEVDLKENNPAGTVVARVTARDADSGENAYISYSIANLQPVPFDVEHFSGALRTTRLLDFESMRREYVVRVRASDWGLPYRRQAELRLTVRLQDVNDNRPQFERVDCVGYISRRLPPGAELATLSAIDFDAGDVVSYRLIGGNDDNCFSLDSSSGIIILACDLSTIRSDIRILNVTATDGTHFADATSVTLHLAGIGTASGPGLECRDAGVARRLTELLAAAERSNAPPDPAEEFPAAPSRYGENLHAPEFLDFPVEVKVNESVALGTTLVKLRARDRDLGYNGLLVFAISGGDDDSAFRVDPDTGELQVIGYLDREREAEYYLNVTVSDLGRPPRSASRLLPVTVLDVNDNTPRFERTLASFRVTENALNGTAVFKARATDKDAGEFARITYSLRGAGEGEFCVDRTEGTLYVCAALDREKRALYELSVRATDGGGRWSEARVRVAVDDVNDEVPRFALPSYSARVREDVPSGALVALLQASDPDLGAGGTVRYSLQDAADSPFAVDELSGALRTILPLDYETRQVHGVTVRATDGGRPALFSEATLIVEVLDVDENLHTPVFSEPVVAGTVREAAQPGAEVLQVTAKDADPPGRDSRLTYYVLAGSGMGYFSVDDTGMIRTLAPLDRETIPHYWLTVCAEDNGVIPKYSCVEVYIEVEDDNDMSPWPERPLYLASVPEHCPANTPVATVTAHDTDASPVPANVTYRIVAGNPDGLFSIDEFTGAIVTTGRALDREAAPAHALEVRASDGALASSARLHITLSDVNDHAPAFTQRYYQLRVPVSYTAMPQGDEAEAEAEADEISTEWEAESDDDDEGSGDVKPTWDLYDNEPEKGLYVGTVLALDADAGDNGTVRYTSRARGLARGVIAVHSRTGRLIAKAPLRTGALYELTVRACDSGAPARCGWARVSLRAVAPGRGAPPALPPPPALHVAELDAPGLLLTLIQAVDPDGDTLYYDIVDGDERREFLLGREDGSLVLARRLLWERQSDYTLNVSVTDGKSTVYAPIKITVVNDLNEGGLFFSRDEYTVDVSEDVRVGEALLALRASVGGGASGRVLYGLLAARAPASLPLFRLDELTGVLGTAQPLDRETAALHELTVWARDSAPRASRAFARVTIRVHDADEHAPEWARPLATARVSARSPPGALVAALHATDRDAGENARVLYSLVGGDAAGTFKVDQNLGEVRLARTLPTSTREYTLHVRAANPPPSARSATLPLHITVVEPDDAPPKFSESSTECEVFENSPAGTALAVLAARSSSSVRYSLRGGGGLLAVDPAAGALQTAAPLDYETQSLYNLTVVATNMGGGTATTQVTVHVLDRNEHAPVLTRSLYQGKVTEDALPGALVHEHDSPEPLVLQATDADSPAHQQRAYEILEPAAAALFSVNPHTGALALTRTLDYEESSRYQFTVRVLDMGTPRLTSDSVATVIVDVVDVNDCAPKFQQPSYTATVLLPTAPDVIVIQLLATDEDSPPENIKYDIIEGDEAGAFKLIGNRLLVAKVDSLSEEYRLKIRASDGRYSGTTKVHVSTKVPEPAGLTFAKSDYYGSVVENSTKTVTVAVLSVLGAALNEHIEFRILNPVEGFHMGVTSGAVRAGGTALDREARAQYTLLVSARSAAGRVAHARLHVAVTDVNDNCPVFVGRPYTAAARAGDPPGTELLRVKAIDADDSDNGEVRYEMKKGHGELFRVDRRSGLITLKQTIDAHNQLYELLIAAFDGGTPACASEATVSVRVWGGGAAPAWPRAHFTLRTREGLPPGAPLAPPLAAASPLQRQLLYTLLQPDRHPEIELHFDTARDGGSSPCVLVCAAVLDHETKPVHELTIRATDGVTGAHADVAVTLIVEDVNDCAPELTQDTYRASVSEAAAVGEMVVTVKATDNDTGVNGEVVYSLSSTDNSSQLFSVERASGEIRVAAPLDRETQDHHHLTLTATDSGTPALLTTAHVFITVDDVNDCSPKFERSVISAVVSREAARGTAVAAVAAADDDARDAGRLHYALVDHDQHHTFAIHPKTGVITLANSRAWSGGAGALTLNVSVSDGAHAAFARVKLTPAPANAHAPAFTHLLHEARVQENLPPPQLCTTVKAYDEDAGEYGIVTYSIPSALLRESFAMDSSTGALTTRVALDRETKAEWLVPVVASDGGARRRHSAVRVRVLDENDNSPVFPHTEYRASFPATRPPGAILLTLTAYDKDDGDNAKITYSIYEGDDKELDTETRGLFAIDPSTGALSLARNATEFASSVVRVWVRARDGSGRAGEAPVSLHVLAAGETPPSPAPPPRDLFLPEDAAPGALIAELQTPGDAPKAKYRLAQGLWPRDQFAIDERGRLVLAAALDRETAPLHRIGVIVEAADAGSPAPAVMLQVTLHVLDVNDNAPAFHSQPYVLYLAENTPTHTSVLQVMAEDPDSGSNGEVRYALAEESAGAPFALDPHSGWLVTAAALDRETTAEHRLAVTATDGGVARRVARGSVVVRLKDYNDCPPKFSQDVYTAEVAEDAAPGTVVVRLEVTDADALTTPLAFHVAGGDPAARFQLRPTGDLLLARTLDRETQDTHEVTVMVTDGKYSATAKVLITVLDANDNPPYCTRHRYYASLREDAAPGTPVVTVEATDADEPQNARLRFYLAGPAADHFTVHRDSGRVTVARELDREVKAVYRLTAHAQDRDRPTAQCSSELVITLDDVNDNAPRFSAARYSVTLPEDAEPGTLVAKVHAVDPDLGANRLLRYTLPEATPGFHLSAHSGILTLRSPLDRETAASHQLLVQATDGGDPPRSATAMVLLTVADVNDNPPEFEFQRYSASVPELDAVGTEVVRVAATSKDTGVNADVYYSIVAGDAREDFAIDRATGAVSIARPLDFERTQQYTLTVQATDGGSPPLSDHASVNISVIDVNDNPPQFAQATYIARVKEDSGVGTRVLQAAARDADSGLNGRVQYTLVRGSGVDHFTVDQDTGYVSLAKPLDREVTPSYVLELRARDRGVPALETSATLNIEVLDANDNAPQFAQNNYSAVVQEGRPLGHAVLTLAVTDADATPNAAPFTFDFQSGNEMGAFRLEPDGSLRTATKFNHRIKDQYILQIRVFDNGTPPLYADAWVYVRVIEESQYPPVVTPLDIQVCSYLDEFPGGDLGRVRATDRDVYDTLTWALAPTTGQIYPSTDLFSIDANDGTLRAAPRLDVGDYRLNVTVSDGKFVSSATVKVSVVLITEEMLAQAVVVRFREVSDVDFVLSHRKGFVRAVSEAVECAPQDVVIISVQPSGDAMNEVRTRRGAADRVRRQVAQDLDVLFAVRDGAGLVNAESLRRLLHAHVERLEERAKLVVEELVRAACGGCGRGACGERAELTGPPRAAAADVYSLVSPAHRLLAACACEPGYGGERCERAVSECARAACPAAARCEEAAAPPGYRCCVAGGECRAPPPVAHFAGDGYALYRLDKGVVNGERLLEDELAVAVRFRTRATHGTLLWAAGRVDYLVLEIVEGYVQFRMELGTGETLARAAAPVSDGAWHEARLERRGASARLTVDRHWAHAHAPPPAAVLDAPAELYVGAVLARHAHALAPQQVTRGFSGCIAELRIGGESLPLEEGAGSRVRATLLRRVRVRTAPRCPPLPPPSPCASYPCLNGGTCTETASLLADDSGSEAGWQCLCHARFGGARCELDKAPCAGQPCLHGGHCNPSDTPPGYTCTCAAPSTGARCQLARYCLPGVCANGGECEEGEWGPSCRCRGYYGPLCQHDVDECAGEPCLHGATCVNEPGSFRCVCPPGRTGDHCGNPLTSGAVLAAGAENSEQGIWWKWATEKGWPLYASGAGLLFLLLLAALLPLACRRKPARKEAPLNCERSPRLPHKLSNLAAERRERPASCACEPLPLNNADTLRSYGSAGDELEGMPPDYLRNLNLEPDRKPWSEQMHLHTFTDNKIYNDLKGTTKPTRPSSPVSTAPSLRARRPGGPAAPGGGDLVGGYHWDCSDWCAGNGALPAITEVPAERRDSTSPSARSPRARRVRVLRPPPEYDTSSGLDDTDNRYDFADASTYLVHPDTYLPPAPASVVSAGEAGEGGADDGDAGGEGTLRALRLREPDAASLITMLEERNSLLGGSCSDMSARLCEIEDSDDEPPPTCRHTDV